MRYVYDLEAGIAWFPTGESDDLVSAYAGRPPRLRPARREHCLGCVYSAPESFLDDLPAPSPRTAPRSEVSKETAKETAPDISRRRVV
jgi:hypothetical protein